MVIEATDLASAAGSARLAPTWPRQQWRCRIPCFSMPAEGLGAAPRHDGKARAQEERGDNETCDQTPDQSFRSHGPAKPEVITEGQRTAPKSDARARHRPTHVGKAAQCPSKHALDTIEDDKEGDRRQGR